MAITYSIMMNNLKSRWQDYLAEIKLMTDDKTQEAHVPPQGLPVIAKTIMHDKLKIFSSSV